MDLFDLIVVCHKYHATLSARCCAARYAKANGPQKRQFNPRRQTLLTDLYGCIRCETGEALHAQR